MTQAITQVDAFTSKPFAGNPAAVCFLTTPRSDLWMQQVAREMNLSETAFVSTLAGKANEFNLRWFTPAVEVDLCGHATLASAHALWEQGRVDARKEISFHTRSGILTASRNDKWIEMDFPATPPRPIPPPQGLAEILGVTPKYVGQSRFDCLAELESEEAVRTLKPDLAMLKAWPMRGLIVTSRAASTEFDFISRFFVPAVGIDEDPVTGSAHCCLGPYWQSQLGKSQFIAHQASARGGELRVEVKGERVLLSGQAVTVLRGELVE
jgi:PhzF family phenazine biosynthesis protein